MSLTCNTRTSTEAAPAPAPNWSLLVLNNAITSIFYSLDVLCLNAFTKMKVTLVSIMLMPNAQVLG